MDIHPPQGPVRNLKDFFLHLSIVTLGIVIALSLDGLLEWHHHRHLVHEARANITREIQDNKADLDSALSNAPAVEKSEEEALHFIEDLIAHQKTEVHALNLSYGIVELHRSSWDTAQTTGAVSYMKYDEVKRYAEVYALQSRLDSLQDQLLNNFIVSLPREDPSHASAPELQDLKHGIQRNLAYLHAGESIAKSLSGKYAQVLATTRK